MSCGVVVKELIALASHLEVVTPATELTTLETQLLRFLRQLFESPVVTEVDQVRGRQRLLVVLQAQRCSFLRIAELLDRKTEPVHKPLFRTLEECTATLLCLRRGAGVGQWSEPVENVMDRRSDMCATLERITEAIHTRAELV